MWSFCICLSQRSVQGSFCCGTLLSAHARTKTSDCGKHRCRQSNWNRCAASRAQDFHMRACWWLRTEEQTDVTAPDDVRFCSETSSFLHHLGQHGPPETFVGASGVSAHSPCHKKDIYGKTFVHSVFTVAGHFVAVGSSAANTPSRGQHATLLCEWHVARWVIPPRVWSFQAVWLSQGDPRSWWDSAFASFQDRPWCVCRLLLNAWAWRRRSTSWHAQLRRSG